MMIWRSAFQVERRAGAQFQGWEPTWLVQGTQRRPVGLGWS